MKRTMAFVCMLMLMLSMVSSAFAWVNPYGALWFDLYNVQCVNTNDLQHLVFSDGDMGNYFGGVPYKFESRFTHAEYYDEYPNGTEGRIYVNHTVTGGGGNSYTNLFHAVKICDMESMTYPYGGVLCGQKWVTPQMWIPIQSNVITQNYHYSVAVRGNTKHHENYGTTHINFRIGVEANQ